MCPLICKYLQQFTARIREVGLTSQTKINSTADGQGLTRISDTVALAKRKSLRIGVGQALRMPLVTELENLVLIRVLQSTHPLYLY